MAFGGLGWGGDIEPRTGGVEGGVGVVTLTGSASGILHWHGREHSTGWAVLEQMAKKALGECHLLSPNCKGGQAVPGLRGSFSPCLPPVRCTNWKHLFPFEL